jgi:succinate-semialdehyde dehydrogenase/glutarate-semialdehyde dehydrogenase
MTARGLLIDGAWVAAADGGEREIRDPATGDLVGTTAIATATDVDAAVAAAQRDAPEWAATHPDERCAILRRAADLIEAATPEIADVLTREQGKPVPDSAKEIAFGVEVLRYYAEEGRRVHGSIRPSVRADVRNLVGYAPVGVVAVIVPWNYPVDLYCWKVAPALAAGCPVVVKPPPEAPLAIGRVAERLVEAGVPQGVLADLPAPGRGVGERLVAHPGVRLVTATASTATGRAIMRAAAEDLKRVSLELGGHTPFVVLDGADVEGAASAAARRSFSNMGQICIAVNRVLVAERCRADFVDALSERVGSMRIGHGVEPGVEYGPVLGEAVRARASEHIEDARRRGGRVVVGGGPLRGGGYDRGTFFAPTVIDDVPLEARVMREETFGPVAAVHAATSDAELLALANASPYGLAAYVYCEDLERAWAFAERVEAGAVGVNVNDTTDLQAPFGGWKLSGMGRELGPEGLMTYLQARHLRMRVRPLGTAATTE